MYVGYVYVYVSRHICISSEDGDLLRAVPSLRGPKLRSTAGEGTGQSPPRPGPSLPGITTWRFMG